MDRARILIVEDEELVALAIKKCLEGFGYEVPRVVASGEEAVRESQAMDADLVLMDIHLQGKMNGIDAAGLIKDSTRVPVVYLTAYSDADTLDKAKLTEPFGFILKPFEERTLEATVKMALSRSRAQKELMGTHDRMSAILHSVGDGIVVTEAGGAIEYANSRATALLQLPDPLPPFISIFPFLKLASTGSSEPVALRVDQVIQGGLSVKLARCSLTRPDGSACLVDMRLEPYRTAGAGSRGIVWVFRDAAERDRIQDFITAELHDAARLHRSLLPPDTIDAGSLRMAGFLLAAGFAAGDLYDFFTIDQEHSAIYMVDVAGHGLAAASLALLLNRLLVPHGGSRLAFLGADALSPKEVVIRLNAMFADGHDQMFFTICYAVVDRTTMRVRMARAGHPYPVIVKKDGSLSEIRAGGNAVGLSPDLALEESEFTLNPGDRLFIYSDGLTECTDAAGAEFSRARFMDLAAESAREGLAEAVTRIRKEVTSWRGSESFDDDVSLVAIEAQTLER
jgi:serine phosphatase RsbU (regulator of sigma subunit)/CheY-like chemotaxis protein